MFKWIGDVFKKVLVNLITIAIILGAAYFIAVKYIL